LIWQVAAIIPKYELLLTRELDYLMMEAESRISLTFYKDGKAESLTSTFDGTTLPG